MANVESVFYKIGQFINGKISALESRMTSAEEGIEALGIQVPPPTGDFTVSDVTWTNVTEIALAEDSTLNSDFSEVDVAEIDLVTEEVPTLVPDPDQETPYFDGVNEPAAFGTPIITLQTIVIKGIEFPAGSRLQYMGVGGDTLESTSYPELAWANYFAQVRLEDPFDMRPRPIGADTSGTWAWHPTTDRGITWEFARNVQMPKQWTHVSGTPDPTRIVNGDLKGTDGAGVAISQSFGNGLLADTRYAVEVVREDSFTSSAVSVTLETEGTVTWEDGTTGDTIQLTAGLNTSFSSTAAVTKVTLDTLGTGRVVSKFRIFSGAISSGSVQISSGGSIEKISGTDGWNAGASSTQSIGGDDNGYVQAQRAQGALKIGLVYSDLDYQEADPFELEIAEDGKLTVSDVALTVRRMELNEWFRIRHYASSNTISFQRKQLVGVEDSEQSWPTDDTLSETGQKVIVTSTGFNLFDKDNSNEQVNYNVGDILEILQIAWDSGGYWRVRITDPARPYNSSNNGGIWHWHVLSQAGTKLALADVIGEDYRTYYTHPITTNGTPLYVDTSFYSLNGRLNDVVIAN